MGREKLCAFRSKVCPLTYCIHFQLFKQDMSEAAGSYFWWSPKILLIPNQPASDSTEAEVDVMV